MTTYIYVPLMSDFIKLNGLGQAQSNNTSYKLVVSLLGLTANFTPVWS
jgi:hypothetical protein